MSHPYDPNDPSDRTLQNAIGAKLGDSGCFANLFEDHYAPLVRYLRTRTDDWHAAEDAASDAWAKIAAQIKNFDPAKGKFQTWLFQIGINSLKDSNKKVYNKRETLYPEMLDFDAAGGDDTTRALEARVAEARLAAEVNALPRKQRTAILCRIKSGMTIEDTATRMGCTPGAVKQLQKRGLERLARQFADDPEQVYSILKPHTTTAIANRETRSQEAPA